ncbi:MAG: short-chain dehydrogenase [Bacteroidetes bacterium]|nr:MAG: short-chain dehydrogenase [Bacteroidota bacterium]
MDINLKSKTAFVCGSTQGIGKAIAIELAELGANIVLLARNGEKLQEIKSELDSSKGQEHHYIKADFSLPNELSVKVEEYLEEHEKVDILINNTGGPEAGTAMDANPRAFTNAFSNHVICNQILVQAVVPGMKKSGSGRIINIISTSVREPIQGLGVSNTIRGAVASWSKTLSKELGEFGITVNNVLPGFTDTARLQALLENKAKRVDASVEEVIAKSKGVIPAGRFATPEEIAYAVAFLASDSASYINGVNLPVDGGRLNCL